MNHSPSSSSRAQEEPAWKDGLIAFVVGTLVYALSCWIIAPGNEAKGFGIQWQMMSAAPQDLPGQLPHRLLAPVLAWACGLGGPHYLGFVRALSVLLLGTVFFFCRRRGSSLVDSLLVTMAVAVTAPIQMYKDHWVGYPDALCYALFFWMLLAAKRPWIFWSLFFVNLLNHELAVFLLPWLWFVRRRAGGGVRADVIGTGITLGLYGTFYLWVKATAPQQLFNVGYFLAHPLFPGGTVVVWLLALVHCVTAFGPILAVLGWHQHTRASGRERWHLWLVLAGVVVIFCIAYDWARHTNLLVLPLVIASLGFLQAGHRLVYVGLLALGVGLMLWIPPWAAMSWPTHELVVPAFECGVVVVLPNDGGYGFGPLSSTLNGWLPRVCPMLSVIAGIAAAIWLCGAAIAWRQRARTA